MNQRAILCSAGLLLSTCAVVPRPQRTGPATDAAVAVSGDSVFLYNSRIARTFTLIQGAPRTRAIANRLAGGPELRVEGPEFVLRLAGGRLLTDADCTASLWWHDAAPDGRATLHSVFRSGEDGLTVEVSYELGAGKPYIRKRLALSREGAEPLHIERIETENLKPTRPAPAQEASGEPVAVEDFFWICEAAASDGGLRDGVLSIGPRGAVDAAQGVPVFTASVVGASFHGRMREAFAEYAKEARRGATGP